MSTQSVITHNCLVPQKELRDFMYGDNARFTAKSTLTGKHYTYKMNKVPVPDAPHTHNHHVELLIGRDNVLDYMHIGDVVGGVGRSKKFIFLNGGDIIHSWSPSIRAIKFVVYHSFSRKACPGLQIWRDTFCDNCGKLLTHPLSVEAKLGPVCRHLCG